MTATHSAFRACRYLGMLVCAAILGMTFPASAGLVETVPQVRASVVAIGTYQRTRTPAFQFSGTGFVVGSGFLIATNAHVIPDTVSAERLEYLAVVMPGDDGERTVRPVKLVAKDRDHDLAVLRFEGGAPLPSLTLGDTTKATEGQNVAFMGFPIGGVLGMTPVTHTGIISAITPIGIPQGNSRDLNPALVRRLASDAFHVYQLDATAYPGNSGSPLFDPDSGAVLGVLNMVFVKSTKESVLSNPSGISYAIPVRYLRKLIEHLD